MESVALHVVVINSLDSINKAIDIASHKSADLLLIAPDCKLDQDIKDQLIAVAYSDPMIGFVTPRSMDIPSQNLPKSTFIPACIGYCLLIKATIVCELGYLDSEYKTLHAALQDYIMRANHFGYRVAQANTIYLQQPQNDLLAILDPEDKTILLQRYREYSHLVTRYNHSPEYKALTLMQGLTPNAKGQLLIGFEFFKLSTSYNGTNECGIKIIQAADKVWPKHYKIVVFCAKESWDFHKLSTVLSKRALRGNIGDPSHKLAAMVAIGQPFRTDDVTNIIPNAPITTYIMLDCIAFDCGYINLYFDPNLWRFVMNWVDIILTISQYSANQMRRRFAIGKDVVLQASLLSTNPQEYRVIGTKKTKNLPKKYLLIVGNFYAHKGLDQYVSGLAKNFPEIEFKVLGDKTRNLANVCGVKSGDLPIDKVAELYQQAEAVIFPSHYEGFGFPLLNSLAYKTPIFVRKAEPYPEIVTKLETGAENVYYFSSLEELIVMLKTGVPEWIGDEARGEKDSWNRHAIDVLQALESKLDTIQMQQISERIRWFQLIFNCDQNSIVASRSSLAKHKILSLLMQIKRKLGLKRSWFATN